MAFGIAARRVRQQCEGSLRKWLGLHVLAGFLLVAMAAPAFAQTAVQSGDWNAPATWGGMVPAAQGNQAVDVPVGITVTIPAGYDGYLMWSRFTLNGSLVINGAFTAGDLLMRPGSSLTINSGGKFTGAGTFWLGGTVVNRGTILAKKDFDLGAQDPNVVFTNEAGATVTISALNSLGYMEGSGKFRYGTFVNRGTFTNKNYLQSYATVQNYGTFVNEGDARWVSEGPQNFPGATLSNSGTMTLDTYRKMSNSGRIANTGTFKNDGTITNNGTFENSCTGTVTGNAITGNPPTTNCSAATPAPAPTTTTTPPVPTVWTNIGGQMAYSSVSAGSSARMVGTTTKWVDGNTYLLHWAGGSFVYENPMVPMMQSSIGADGTWWGVKANGSIFRKIGTSWVVVAGSLNQVSVGSASMVWGVNSNNDVFKWTGSGWIRIASGAIRHISVAADGTVWGITPTSAIVRWNGSSFVTMPGQAVQVAVGSASNVWVVNAAGTVYQWNGTSWNTITEAGASKAISAAADGTVLVIRAADNMIYRKP
jgi:Tectonin domain